MALLRRIIEIVPTKAAGRPFFLWNTISFMQRLERHFNTLSVQCCKVVGWAARSPGQKASAMIEDIEDTSTEILKAE